MKTLRYIDQTIREGPQTLWGMRITPAMILPIASALDSTGFSTIDFTGGNLMAVVTRVLRQDPWAGLRLIRDAIHKTPIRAAIRTDGITMRPASLELLSLWIRTLARNGIRSIWLFDVLFNIQRIKPLVEVARSEGIEVLGSVMWSESPFHTDEYYVRNLKALVQTGITGIYFEDAVGCLTPERCKTLLPALREAAGDLEIEFHMHNSTGMAPLCYIEAVKAGILKLHTAIPPMADGGAIPSLWTIRKSMQALGYQDELDISPTSEISRHLEFVADNEGFPKGEGIDFDVRIYDHQIPGGAMGTLLYQLETLGLRGRLDEILVEAARVRKELGYPGMATPYPQFISAMAVTNLISRDRYETVPDEIILYLQGYYGDIVGPVDQNVKDKILSSTRAKKLEGFRASESIADLRGKYGSGITDEELILRASMPGDDVDMMKKDGRPTRAYDTPITAIVQRFLDISKGNKLRGRMRDLDISLARHGRSCD